MSRLGNAAGGLSLLLSFDWPSCEVFIPPNDNTSAPDHRVLRSLHACTRLFLMLWSRQRGCPRKRQRRRGVKSLPSHQRVGNAVGVSIGVVRSCACVTFFSCYIKNLPCVSSYML